MPWYLAAQFAGAFAGTAAAAWLWGDLARSVQLAATVPGDGWTWIGALLAVAAYRGGWGSGTVCEKLYHTAAYPCPFPSCGYRLVKAGGVVMREGEAGDEAYLVERGELAVTRAGVPLARLTAGDWVGEMSLLLKRGPRR